MYRSRVHRRLAHLDAAKMRAVFAAAARCPGVNIVWRARTQDGLQLVVVGGSMRLATADAANSAPAWAAGRWVIHPCQLDRWTRPEPLKSFTDEIWREVWTRIRIRMASLNYGC